MRNLKKILSLIPISHRKPFLLLCLFSSFVAFVELIGVAAIIPLVSLLSDKDVIKTNKFHEILYAYLDIDNLEIYVYLLGALTLVFFVFRAIINFMFVSFTARFAYDIFQYFQEKVFKSFISSSYIHFINKLSLGGLLKVATKEIGSLTVIISSFMLILSEAVVFLSIFSVLFYINYKITVAVIALVSVVGIINLRIISKKILHEGLIREKLEGEIYSSLKETFLGYKLIKLLPNTSRIEDIFFRLVFDFSNSNVRNQKLQNLPRITMETSAYIILILIVISIGISSNNDAQSISLISFFVLALFRMLPSINRIISSYHIILYSLPAADIVKTQIEIPSSRLKTQCLPFSDEISFKNVSFGYDSKKLILDNINFTINSGDIIIIKGKSGSGKSTLIDLILGLISPLSGSISVDQKVLSDKKTHICNEYISYLDQNIYISNDTVANNISLGRERNDDKILKVLRTALLNTQSNLNFPLDYHLGEAGAKMSGGQKQRLSIARALYSNSNLLILDEPTSSLDNKIASKFAESLISSSADKTLLIIDHRGHFTKYANKIFTISNSKLYVEIIN